MLVVFYRDLVSLLFYCLRTETKTIINWSDKMFSN